MSLGYSVVVAIACIPTPQMTTGRMVTASAASSHSEHPVIDVGLNAEGYGRAVIAAFDILTVSVCLKDA